MKVQIITIGDEILIGQIVDTNSAWMGEQLNKHGASVEKISSVADTASAIQSAMQIALNDDTQVILLTGGLGPTKDDITKKTLADLFQTELIFHDETYQRILSFFKKLNRSTTPAHKEQCYMPKNATILRNKMGTAPGMWFEYNNKVIVSMPGVPYEMKYLMEHEVIPRLTERFPVKPIFHKTILTAGEGESRIAVRIEDIEANLPENIKLAFLPNLGQVRLRFSGRGDNIDRLEQAINAEVDQVKKRIPELIFGYNKDKLEEVVGQMLKAQNKTIATAESCTGGLLAHKITSIAGSSAYFQGSIIAYSNTIKSNLLKVADDTLEQHGAVSEATVKEMVQGTLNLLHTDIAIAISGIAGPTGGTPEKPVGTIWIAIGDNKRIKTRLLHAGKNRIKNIEYTASHALNMIRLFLLEEKKPAVSY